MASKKAKKKSPRRAGAGKKGKHSRRKLRTQFMVDFVNGFLREGSEDLLLPGPNETKEWLWPKPTQTMQQIMDDYQSAVKVLMTVGYSLGAAPSVPAGSLGADIVPFLNSHHWPSAAPTVPPEWEDDQPMVHLVEIAVILDWLLAAVNAHPLTSPAAGGGGSHWPPH